MKRTFKHSIFASLLPLLLLALFYVRSELKEGVVVVIESDESKTSSGGPVINKIKWIQGSEQDIWIMNQSHSGPKAHASKWDRLAIVIDKAKSPKTARFYQLEPGPLEWNKDSKEVPYSVSCYICHSNGPRAIRPNLTAPEHVKLSAKEWFKVQSMNLRIKLYGRVVPHSDHATKPIGGQILDGAQKPIGGQKSIGGKKPHSGQKAQHAEGRPFRFSSSYENQELSVKTCNICHKDSGFGARGALRRQNLPTIKFLLDQGHMPPFPFQLSSDEKAQIRHFMEGF